MNSKLERWEFGYFDSLFFDSAAGTVATAKAAREIAAAMADHAPERTVFVYDRKQRGEIYIWLLIAGEWHKILKYKWGVSS